MTTSTTQPAASVQQEAGQVVADNAEAVMGVLVAAWAALQADVVRLRVRWAAEPEAVRVRRLAALDARTAQLMAAATTHVRRVLPGTVRDVFHTGGAAAAGVLGLRVVWGPADAEVLDGLTRDLWADLAEAIAYVQTSTRSMTRALEELAGSIPEARVETARQVRRVVDERGPAAVVYRDGSRHGLDEYARMAVRTKLAQAWQVASFRVMDAAGVGFVELTDGNGCGLRAHSDPQKANGLVVPLALAQAYPLSHPRCVRSSYPRPDITSTAQARTAAPVVSPPGGVMGEDAGPLSDRAVRGTGGLLDVRAPAASGASARHATVARRVAPVGRATLTGRTHRTRGPSGG